jgi:hypothetical protein
VKDVIDVTVSQVRLFAIDCLPFNELRVPVNARKIQETFKFGNVQIDPFGIQVSFANGIFECRGKSISVLSLSFEQRKIFIQIRGRSPAADAFYSAISKILQSVGKDSKVTKYEPLLKAEETNCISTLEIDFEDLIASSLWKLIQTDIKEKFRTPYGNPKSIAFKNVSFEVKYELLDPRLSEYEVALSNKLFTIEPRAGTPLSEKRFFTSSPTDSETHLAILEEIEKVVAKSQRTKRQ